MKCNYAFLYSLSASSYYHWATGVLMANFKKFISKSGKVSKFPAATNFETYANLKRRQNCTSYIPYGCDSGFLS